MFKNINITNENKDEIWNELKIKLQSNNKISPDVYNHYIKQKCNLISVENDIFIFLVESEWSINYLNNYKKVFIQEIKSITNKEYFVKFIHNESKNNTFKNKVKKINKANEKNYFKDFTLSNFVQGPSNVEAFQASLGVIESLGNLWNPLFIYGDPGLGKTHLLHAIKTACIKKYPNKKIFFYKSQDFGREIIERLIDFKKIEKWKSDLSNSDLLIIDDIQVLATREKTNEILFSIINNLIESNKQLIIVSDKSTNELTIGFEKRLISRFNKGLIVQITPPDFETAVKIIEKKFKHKTEYVLAENTINFIAENFKNDVRSIEGILNRILFWTILDNKILKDTNVIKLEYLTNIIGQWHINYENKITAKKIINFIGKKYQISAEVLKGNNRSKQIVAARNIAIYLIRNILKLTYKIISLEFGNKNHTTMMHAYKKVEEKIKMDFNFKKIINNLKEQIKKNKILK